MNISLTPQLERFIKDKVATGSYHSTSEVVREALRLLEEQDALKQAKLEALRHDLGHGITSLDKGLGEALDITAIKAAARQQHG